MNCCIAKAIGISASGNSRFDFTLVSVATPLIANTPPAVKLAEAEKHMFASVYTFRPRQHLTKKQEAVYISPPHMGQIDLIHRGIEIPRGICEMGLDEVVVQQTGETKRQLAQALRELYESQWEVLPTEERQRCPFPVFQNALMRGSQETLWHIARVLDDNGCLFHVNESGKPVFTDRGLDSPPKLRWPGRSYRDIQEELDRINFDEQPRNAATRVKLFPVGSHPGDAENLSPEIRAFERQWPFAPQGVIGKNPPEVLLEAQVRNRPWYMVRPFMSDQPIMGREAQSARRRRLGTRIMLEVLGAK